MSITADLDKFSALISLLDLKDSSNQDNQNGIAYHSLNEQMMAKLQGSIFNQSNARNDSRKLVGKPPGLSSVPSSTGSNSSLASPPYAPTSSVLSCLGLQSSDTMLQMCPEENGRFMDEDQQQELVNGHRCLDRSASEPYNRGLASSAYSVTRTASNNSSSSSNSSGGSSYCRYKTELCRPFDENGSCKYGDKCQFAHGRHELRSLARHPKYKTDLCKTYHTTGLCPYGPRCHFIHNDEERQLNLVNRLVLGHKKTQAMYEQHRTQLAHQQQVIAAAVAAQKLLQQQQQQQQQQQHPTLTKQMSVDAALMAAQQLQQQQQFQLQHQTSALFNYRGSVDSSSDSPSSSITESPSPSPTSLMFEDPAATMSKHNNAAYRMTGTNAWSSLDETTHVSGSSDALQTILESILKTKSAGSRPSFRDYIGEAENSYSSFQSVSYLH